jgi:hypothetical protein
MAMIIKKINNRYKFWKGYEVRDIIIMLKNETENGTVKREIILLLFFI